MWLWFNKNIKKEKITKQSENIENYDLKQN